MVYLFLIIIFETVLLSDISEKPGRTVQQIVRHTSGNTEALVNRDVTMYNGLSYRKYRDTEKDCFLMIAEHDPYTQIIKNYSCPF